MPESGRKPPDFAERAERRARGAVLYLVLINHSADCDERGDGRIREWDCGRGGGFDRLNVFTPAARLLHAIPAPANGPAARLIS
jgi:hypothetical protein